MSVAMTNAEGITELTLTSDPQSALPTYCQLLKGLCCNQVCCSRSQHLKNIQGTSQSALGSPGAGSGMSGTMTKAEEVTELTLTSDPQIALPTYCQLLKGLCCNQVCCSRSQHLKNIQGTSQSALGSPGAGSGMSVTMTNAEEITELTLTSDPQIALPTYCQLLKGLCCNQVCCSRSQHLKNIQGTSQSALGSPGAGSGMSVTMANAEEVTELTLTSDPQSALPTYCQLLKGLCCNQVCCSRSQHLKNIQGTSQSALGSPDDLEHHKSLLEEVTTKPAA